MPNQVQEALLSHRGRSKQTEPESLVFVSRAGTPINPGNVRNRVLRPTCERLGLPMITWHSFRHTHATGHDKSRSPLREMQNVLGHADSKTTMRYVHSIPTSAREAMERVANYLDPNGPKFDNLDPIRSNEESVVN